MSNNNRKSAEALHRIIFDCFGYDDDGSPLFEGAKADIMEDLSNGYSAWHHIYILMNALLPVSCQYAYTSICPLIRHVKRTRRIGLYGMMYDETAVYRVDAILAWL